MKKITLLFLITIITSVVMAQTTFNWVSETISPENNLRQMHVYEDNTAVIVGLNNVLTKYDPATTAWNSVNSAKPTFDFIDLSIKNGFGILSSRRAMMINNPSNDDLYANGRFLKTTDNGATWTNFDLSPMAAIEIDSLNPIDKGSLAMDIFATEYIDENNILLYSGWYDYRTETKVIRGAVFATTDGGLSWAPITEDIKSAVITSIYNNGTYNVIAGLNFLRIHNTGETLSTDIYPALVTANGGVDAAIYIFDITIVDANTFYVATAQDGIFSTKDAGTSFTKLASGAPAGANDFYVHNSNVMMALGSSANSKATIDGGTTWVNCYPGASCWEISGVFNGYLYALAKSVVYKMTVADFEAGTYNWTTTTVKEGFILQKMYIIDDANAFIIGAGETVIMSTDGGLTWADVVCPDPILPILNEIDFSTLDASAGLSLAATTRMKLIDYDENISEYEDFYVDGLIFKSTDNFETYSILDITKIGELASEDASLNTSLDACYGSSPVAVAVLNETTIMAAITWFETIIDGKITHTRIFKSVDTGDTWKSVSDDLGSSFITGINFLNENYGFVAGNKVLLKSTDGGETFTDIYPILDVDSDDSMFVNEVNIINQNELYITTAMDGVYQTLDGGATFTKFVGISGSNGFVKLNNSTFMTLGGNSDKCKYSNDWGTTLESCYPGSSVYAIGSILNGYLYGLGKGVVYKISIDELIVTTGINTLPKFNAISIRYLAESIELVSSEAQIDQCILYSITGKVMGSYAPKSASFKIDTNNLPSGIYVAATISNGKRFINKFYVK